MLVHEKRRGIMRLRFLMSVLMVLGLVAGACGSDTGSEPAAQATAADSSTDDSSSDGKEESADPGETRILMVDQPAVQDLVDNWIPKFEAATGIDVTVEVIPESGLDARMTLGADSDQFDVVMVGVKNWSPAITAGWLAPIDDYLADEAKSSSDWLGGMPPELMANLQTDGVSYAVPYIASANLLFYNKAMFAAAGLDPDNPPSNLDEVVEAAKVLDADGQVGYVGRGTRDQISFPWLMFWLLNGGRWPAPGPDARFDLLLEDESVKATTQMVELLGNYGPDGIASYTYADAQLAMQQGLAAMWYDAAQLGPALNDPEESLVAGDIGFKSLEGVGDAYVTGAVWAWAMMDGTSNGDPSWELIKFLTSEEVAAGQAVGGVNPSPGRTSVLSDPDVQDALGSEFLDALAIAIPQANPAYTPLIPEGGAIRNAVALALSEILDGDDIIEALTRANAEVVKLTSGG